MYTSHGACEEGQRITQEVSSLLLPCGLWDSIQVMRLGISTSILALSLFSTDFI